MNAKEFKILIEPVKDKLFRLALRMLGNYLDAEDGMQELLAKLWLNRAKIDAKNNPEAYVMVAARNHFIDIIRKKKPILVHDQEDFLKEKNPDALAKLEQKEDFNLVHDLVNRLPEKQKLVFHLRDIENYTYEEISKMSEMSVNSIKVNLSRARKKLREWIMEYHTYKKEMKEKN